MSPRTITPLPITDAEILDAYSSGKSVHGVIRSLGVSKAHVLAVLDAHRLNHRDNQARRLRAITDPAVAPILRAYLDAPGSSISDLAAATDRTPGDVYAVLVHHLEADARAAA